MKTFLEKLLVGLIGFPIGIVFFLAITVFTTLLWPIYWISKGIECIIGLFVNEYNSNAVNDLLEFIFVMYGFATLFILLPLSIFDDTLM